MRSIAVLALGFVLAAAAAAQPAQSWEPYSADLQARAAAGEAGARFALGEAYRTGNGIGPDREQAIAWYRKAASSDPRAADALGVLLFTKGERKQAIPLLQASAGRRNVYALYILGTARFNGDYVPKDVGRAFADMRVAAATLPQARRSLGLMEPYVGADDRQRADLLAAQPGGPEAGAPTAPSYVLAPPVIVPRRKPAASRPAAALPRPAVTAAIPDDTGDAPAPPRAVKLAAPEAGEAMWKVQLGAYGSEERAAAQWRIIARAVPALAGLRRVTEPAGSLVRLQAAGLPSREDAAALCRSVAATGGDCFVVGQ